MIAWVLILASTASSMPLVELLPAESKEVAVRAVTKVDAQPARLIQWISASPDGAHRYLVHLNRSRSDVLDGVFGGFIRRTIARRLRSEAPQALRVLRERLESAPPEESDVRR